MLCPEKLSKGDVREHFSDKLKRIRQQLCKVSLYQQHCQNHESRLLSAGNGTRCRSLALFYAEVRQGMENKRQLTCGFRGCQLDCAIYDKMCYYYNRHSPELLQGLELFLDHICIPCNYECLELCSMWLMLFVTLYNCCRFERSPLKTTLDLSGINKL